jgi:hypothetical protein
MPICDLSLRGGYYRTKYRQQTEREAANESCTDEIAMQYKSKPTRVLMNKKEWKYFVQKGFSSSTSNVGMLSDSVAGGSSFSC